MDHDKVLQMRDLYWHQRALINWGVLGDHNTDFFHTTAITRKMRNMVRANLLDDGNWVTSEKGIRDEFLKHYKTIYKKGARRRVEDVYPADLIFTLPKSPDLVLNHLEADPSDLEIKSALMSLGPSKAPGPDGFTAGVVQDNWDAFGPFLLAEMRCFFTTKVMQPHIARSNLVLIPKTEEANRVGQFRPICVYNLVYKIISKILAKRMKPCIDPLISKSQSAFISRKEISNNIILFREILHSFKQKRYKRKEFCLKVDLSKAFDRMDWSYIISVLSLYSFPSRFTNWIMGCVVSTQFSLVFNGRGDAFFTPKCGLRQGYALSPYLFILNLDLLSRGFQYQVEKGLLQRVRIAPSAQPITDCFYANDLLLLGAATQQEAASFIENLTALRQFQGSRLGLISHQCGAAMLPLNRRRFASRLF